MAEKDQAELYQGADCHCCGKKQVREHHGATGGMSQPGTPGGLICPDCDTEKGVIRPPGWPQRRPPASG